MQTPVTDHTYQPAASSETTCRRIWAESGATSVEYALLGSLIAALISVTVGLLGGVVGALYESIRWW
jgi:Flp pilus assembly pilin Flp